jgi:hypothetical protein
MGAPAWRRFTSDELRLSRAIDTARAQMESADDAGDLRLAAVWREALAQLERLIPGDPPPPEATSGQP